jgi:hypothetical protein
MGMRSSCAHFAAAEAPIDLRQRNAAARRSRI